VYTRVKIIIKEDKAILLQLENPKTSAQRKEGLREREKDGEVDTIALSAEWEIEWREGEPKPTTTTKSGLLTILVTCSRLFTVKCQQDYTKYMFHYNCIAGVARNPINSSWG
jgi:hypothetical protein